MFFWTIGLSVLTALLWIGAALVVGVNWTYLDLKINMRPLAVSVAQSYREAAVFAAFPLFIVTRFTRSTIVALLVALPVTYVFCVWHTHLDGLLTITLGELAICIAFLKVSRWGEEPFAGFVASGTAHWFGNMMIIAVANLVV
jgi:hypothetical protein